MPAYSYLSVLYRHSHIKRLPNAVGPTHPPLYGIKYPGLNLSVEILKVSLTTLSKLADVNVYYYTGTNRVNPLAQ